MQLPPTNVVFAMIVNISIFLGTFLLSMWAFQKLGWNPRKQQNLQVWELFLLIILFAVLMMVICFRCSVVVDGLVAGLLLATMLNLIYEVKNRLK